MKTRTKVAIVGGIGGFGVLLWLIFKPKKPRLATAWPTSGIRDGKVYVQISMFGALLIGGRSVEFDEVIALAKKNKGIVVIDPDRAVVPATHYQKFRADVEAAGLVIEIEPDNWLVP